MLFLSRFLAARGPQHHPGRGLLLLVIVGLTATWAFGLMAVNGRLDASDAYVAGGDATRVTALAPAAVTLLVGRAAGHERALGLARAARRTVERVADLRGHATFDEVVDFDAVGRPAAILRYGVDGRLAAVSRLGWVAGAGRPLAADSDAVAAALGIARSVGLAPIGSGAALRTGTNGWSVRWDRVVDGIPVPGDGVRVGLWPDGTFHDLTSSSHPLAERPAATIDYAAAEISVGQLLDRWIPSANRAEATIAGGSLAWVAPNDTFEAALPDAPADTRRLAWVVRVASSGSFAEAIRSLEVWLDAADGSLLGGDVAR